MEELKKRLEEQDERHEGGNNGSARAAPRPLAPAATTPKAFASARTKTKLQGVKVWDKRDYKNLDDSVELGTRNIKVALRRLHKFARDGEADVLDLDDTIKSTAMPAISTSS